MTLVEIILAMAILGLIVILMTPIMVAGFNMIALSGSRHVNAKDVAGDIENNLAGAPVTASLHDVVIELPGGIEVGGKTFTVDQGSGIRRVDLNGFIIGSIPFFSPTLPGSTSTTASPATSATSGGTGATTSGTTTTAPTATSAPTTTAPTAAPISLGQVSVDVSGWRDDSLAVNRIGIIRNTATAMEYRVMSFDGGTIHQNWTTCASTDTSFNLATNNQGYQVIVRQRTNPAINRHYRIRSAPLVAFRRKNANFTSFVIRDPITMNWRDIVTSDRIELILTPGDTWTLVTTGLDVRNIDTTFVFARLAASGDTNIGGITFSDPASFPRRLTSWQ